MPRGIRPTQDKVRKALFDILRDIRGLSFLELFAGSGAVGIEALSQGAKEVVFVEKDKKCIRQIEQNLAFLGVSSAKNICAINSGASANSCGGGGSANSCGGGGSATFCGGGYRVIGLDALRAIRQLKQEHKKFDIIFLDPPYYRELTKKTLQTLSDYDILAADGFVITQHFKKDNLPDALGVLNLFKQSRYGDTILSFYRKSNQKPEHSGDYREQSTENRKKQRK